MAYLDSDQIKEKYGIEPLTVSSYCAKFSLERRRKSPGSKEFLFNELGIMALAQYLNRRESGRLPPNLPKKKVYASLLSSISKSSLSKTPQVRKASYKAKETPASREKRLKDKPSSEREDVQYGSTEEVKVFTDEEDLLVLLDIHKKSHFGWDSLCTYLAKHYPEIDMEASFKEHFQTISPFLSFLAIHRKEGLQISPVRITTIKTTGALLWLEVTVRDKVESSRYTMVRATLVDILRKYARGNIQDLVVARALEKVFNG